MAVERSLFNYHRLHRSAGITYLSCFGDSPQLAPNLCNVVTSTNDSRIVEAGSIIFYPNPTSSSITLETSSNNLLERVIISAIDGRVIKSLVIAHSEKTTVDLKELSAGIYFLDCVGEKGSQKIKVVKY